MEIKEYLPIGSIVQVNDGLKKLMVTGIKQTDTADNIEYDYVGIMYPEGYLGDQFQFVFNHDEITEILFRGFEDEERDNFLTSLENYVNDNESSNESITAEEGPVF